MLKCYFELYSSCYWFITSAEWGRTDRQSSEEMKSDYLGLNSITAAYAISLQLHRGTPLWAYVKAILPIKIEIIFRETQMRGHKTLRVIVNY